MPIDIEHFCKNLQLYERKHHLACARAIERFAEAVIARASELAPVGPSNPTMPGAGPPRGKEAIKTPGYIGPPGHPGFLKDAGHVEDAVITAETISCVMGFNAYYAAAVHERLDARHPRGGQAKYLETAMRELAPRFKQYIQDELNKEFP